MSEDEIRELFVSMRDDPVPVESLGRLHIGLAHRTSRRDYRKLFAAALVLVPVCLWLISLALHPIPAVHPPTPPAPLVVPALEVSPPVRARHKPRRVPAHNHRDAQAHLIRIETSDPDVVILLVGN